MQGIFVDLENELTDIAAEVDLLARSIALYDASPSGMDSAWRWLAVQGFASAVEKVYVGCERVMSMIATEIDGAKVEHDDSWHISLLRRMAHPYPGVRDAVISPECFSCLDRLRAFRHRERNTYGLALDAEVVRERAAQGTIAFARFRSEIQAFAARSGGGS